MFTQHFLFFFFWCFTFIWEKLRIHIIYYSVREKLAVNIIQLRTFLILTWVYLVFFTQHSPEIYDSSSFSSCSQPLSDLFFFLFFLFYFLTLQYCIGFAIYQNESTTGIHVFPIWTLLPPPSPYHPSGSSQCTSPKHPVSCIEPGLATRFIRSVFIPIPKKGNAKEYSNYHTICTHLTH